MCVLTLNNIKRTPLAVVDNPASFDASRRTACIIRGAANQWPACRDWSPQHFRERYGALEVTGFMNVPETDSPYFQRDASHRTEILVSDFLDRAEAGECCIVDANQRARFDGLLEDCNFEDLVGDADQFSSLWLGSRTRSGLHYDILDNFLIQVHGKKEVIVVAPGAPRDFYNFPEDMTKSRVDPLDLDLKQFPRFANTTLLEGNLEPGDALYLPQGWWHHLYAPATSISINCWYGPPIALSQHMKTIAAAGPKTIATFTKDFVWHGILGRPYTPRLYCPPPIGRIIYEMLYASFRRRFETRKEVAVDT